MSYRRVIISEYGGPDVLRIVEEEKLPEPLAGEVRVRISAAGAAFTDIMVRKGIYPGVKQKPPFSPGYDMVGIVDKIGTEAKKFKKGDRVAALTVTGSYSEYMCLPESELVSVPDELDPAEAVSVILPYVTAYQMLHRSAKIKKGQIILVHGAGGAVGSALLRLGKLNDLDMFGTDAESKHESIKGAGAVPIDYEKEDFVNVVIEKTGDGVDAAFDAVGGDHFKRSFRALRPKGTLVAYGFYDAALGKGGNVPLDFLRLKLWNLLPNGKSALFYSVESLQKKHPDWFKEDLTELFKLLKEKKIKPVIHAGMPFTEAAEAHKMIENKKVNGKIILMMNDSGSD